MPYVAPSVASDPASQAHANTAFTTINTNLNEVCTNIIVVLDELLKAARVTYLCHPNEFNATSPTGTALPPGLAVAEAALVAARAVID